MQRLLGPVLVTALLSAGSISSGLSAGAPAPVESPERPPDQSILTFPEWYLVFSPDEYARYIATEPPSGFPYSGHIGQLWSSYGSVTDATRIYPFNAGYHVMILVIGTSTTVEYTIKGGYEQLVGRATEALRPGMTAEDHFAARVAREYVDFIEIRPWYEFDFLSRLERLWALPPTTDAGALRGLERRYALGTEYAVKAVYGAFIEWATHASYVPSEPRTRLVLDRLPPIAEALPDLELISEGPEGVTVDTPRQQPFTAYARTLAKSGATFRRIAGNEGDTAVSVILSSDWRPRSARVLFTQPMITEPPRVRVLLVMPVSSLAATLNELDRPDAELEHVFDF